MGKCVDQSISISMYIYILYEVQCDGSIASIASTIISLVTGKMNTKLMH